MFVAGCHRSGTSLLASLVGEVLQLGVDEASQLAPPALDNPLGFYESRRLVECNDQLLGRIGCSWSHPPLCPPAWDHPPLLDFLAEQRHDLRDLAMSDAWVEKDPRICLTYPAYLHVFLKRVPLLAIIRSPLAVATSLYARDGIDVNTGLVIWFIYNHHLSRALVASDVLMVYEKLLEGVEPSISMDMLDQLAPVFEQSGFESPNLSDWKKALDKLIRPELNRAANALPLTAVSQINKPLLSCCQSAYEIASQSTSDEHPMHWAFDALPSSVLDMGCRFGVFNQGDWQREQQQQALCVDLEDCRRRCGDLDRRLGAMEASTSWRLTAPLRRAADFLRR